MRTKLLVGVGTAVLTSGILVVGLVIAMVWASSVAPVSAAHETQTGLPEVQPAKTAICHVPNKTNQSVPFATGTQIEISRDACVAHCTNHGGDQVMSDASCAADVVPDGAGGFVDSDDQCIVNSPSAFCSVARCIARC